MTDHIAELKKRFLEGDIFPGSMGVELVELKEGEATVAMEVRRDMTNFHGTVHGGAVFTLADTAFALACNSHGIPAVALSVTIDYFAPAQPGARLTATAVEIQKTKRTGNYHITVASGDGRRIAFVRGVAFFRV